jgi:ribonuclease G
LNDIGHEGHHMREIIINADPDETRIAILEDGALVELLLERTEKKRRVGDIYKGKVTAVLPGMQAAFVDIGEPKTAFLHVSDLAQAWEDLDDGVDFDGGERGDGGHGRGSHRQLKIEDCLKKGEEILLQVTKEPIGTKGPRATTQISLPGRFLVLMPGVDHVGVSRRIPERDERTRLKKLASEVKPEGAGLIVRTVGEGQGKRQFASDVKYLWGLWKRIQRRAGRGKAPALLHKDMELATGLIRDLFREDVQELVIDSKKVHKEIMGYLRSVSPELCHRVKLFKGDTSIFEAYGIEKEIESTTERRIQLRHGGYIVIDHTEALVAIDVNSGRYVGKKDHEETILKTNLEAAKEIARQLRLRDIGGIIVIDFIDMEREANKRAVLDTLKDCLRRDRSRTKTFQVSDLGLVEMTRQRVRPSLLHYYTDDCPACGGSGKVLTLQSVGFKAERMIRKAAVAAGEKRLVMRVHPDAAAYIIEHNGKRLELLEKQYKLDLDIRDDPRLKRDAVELLSGRNGRDLTGDLDS